MCPLQGGDCFDLSHVLCSLLLGAGYDAYVVAGYAPLAVVRNDERQASCPLLEAEQAKPSGRPASVVPTTKQHSLMPKEVKYKIKSDMKMESKFLQVQGSTVYMTCTKAASLRRCLLSPSQHAASVFLQL